MEIKYEVTNELILRHIYKMSTEELARVSLTVSNSMRPLFWHDGILFFFYSMPHVMNNDLANDYLKGKERWEEVYFAEMPIFKETLEIDEGEFKGAKIHVIKASGFTPHREFVDWLKRNQSWMSK